jgi:hypothetical protein
MRDPDPAISRTRPIGGASADPEDAEEDEPSLSL